jgi:hypothetical protein
MTWFLQHVWHKIQVVPIQGHVQFRGYKSKLPVALALYLIGEFQPVIDPQGTYYIQRPIDACRVQFPLMKSLTQEKAATLMPHGAIIQV